MGERGDIILDGLLRTIAGLLLIALVAFEVGAVVVNEVQLDGAAQRAAREGARVLEGPASVGAVEAAADHAAAALKGAEVTSVDIDDDRVTVTVARPAPVLVVDRVPALRERLLGTASARARKPR